MNDDRAAPGGFTETPGESPGIHAGEAVRGSAPGQAREGAGAARNRKKPGEDAWRS
ncbi:MAG: hypothetical protein HSCHL_1437 [Hydrogenibacillus schlegelii]|uniref:Uncharacterized protein n=1 Tax=Hydrogenibacillus schlegelii TaxID=1484 RepID=A0A2T5GC93_HYDSH|nr:MAG: hypothetical protein HSCHL_1437 [Hydrogenibacillus schlegelii]